MALGTPILFLLLMVLAIAVGVFLIVFLIVPLFKGIKWLVKHVFTFVFGMILDVLRLVGSIVTAIVMVPLVIANVVLGRWSGAAHYGRSLQSEIVNGALSIYRVAIGHPARFLLLSALTEGLEKRLPAAVAAAPSVDRPAGRAAQFDGYTIVGSLQAGGSGGKLYVANPDAAKRAAFDRAGHRDVQQVVIKTFSLDDGSELPQIVRESRALDAAKKLGLVLDHELTGSRFYYAMRYVPGQPLGLVTPQLHAASGGNGLDDRHLRVGIGYIGGLLSTLENYHRGGLWHKDVKPDNIIVDGDRATLVDFGLVTPLRSSMTLTTHGTEYFRDPELVRLALKGVKVSEVDGARFDVYAAGAVLYSIVENSFPAHGVLSQVTKRCPEALRWVIRRAMADYDKRYPSAAAMILDLKCVAEAADPFAVKPIDLPSMQGQVPASPRPVEDVAYRPAYVSMPGMGMGAGVGPEVAYAGSPVPPPIPRGVGAGSAGGVGGGGVPRTGRARISIKNWWTGEFSVRHEGAGFGAGAGGPAAGIGGAAAGMGVGMGVGMGAARVEPVRPAVRRSAAEQLNAARSRAAAARERVRTRMAGRRGKSFSNEPNAGVFMALFLFLGVCVLIGGAIVAFSMSQQRRGAASQLESDWEGGWAVMTLPVVPAHAGAGHVKAPGAPSVSGVPAAEAPMTDVEDPGDGNIEVDPVADAGSADATVFVWVDMARPLSAEHEAMVKEISDRLKEEGFEVVGDVPGIQRTAEQTQRVLDRQARLVTLTTGLAGDSPQFREAVSGWASADQGADLVLRFRGSVPASAGGKPGPDVMNCWLVARRGQDEDERGRLRDAFQTAQRVIERGSLD